MASYLVFNKIVEMENAQSAYEKKMMEQAQKQEAEQQRQAILIQLLTPQAKQRLMKIKTVKPEKAIGIQNSLIKAAQAGMIKNRVTEKELVNLLEKESERKGEQKITFKRRGIDDQW